MKSSKFLALYLLCLIVSLPCLSSIIRAEDTLKAKGAKTNPSQRAHFIQFDNDQLTVKVKDVSLKELLEEIARQGDLTLVLSGSLEEQITIEFHLLSLEEGLRRIFRQRNFAVEYSTTSEESPPTGRRPKALWVFSGGEEGSPPQTTIGDDGTGRASSQDGGRQISRLQAALTREDPSEREEAVESLGETGRPDAVAPLKLALKDVDKDVRQAAIAALASIGGDEAAHALATALQDQDALVREAAVEALADIGGETAVRLLEQALTDEDEAVRETADELLEELRHHIR